MRCSRLFVEKLQLTNLDDQVLAAKLEREREVELESSDPSEPSPEIEAFKQNSEWEVVDHPGTHEITLSKTFGNETYVLQLGR